MRIRYLALALFGLAAGLLISAAPIDAQGKKTKKDDVGVVEIFKNSDGAYRYRIKNAEGKTIAIPLPQMTWDKKTDVIKAIDELKTILNDTKPIEVKADEKDDKKSDK